MKSYMQWVRTDFFPTAFCAGCGHGILLRAIVKSLEELKLDKDKVVFVSGIGCSGWIPSPYINTDSIHTTHGRALAFATGVKLSRPDFTVIVVGGDGDLASIGGNHLIHAARRNINITCIMADNNNYGMTGGQYSPTTPMGAKTLTSKRGHLEPPFDVASLVKAAGASYVARYTVAHFPQLVNAIKRAITTEGFSFIQALSTCPTHYGRRNVTQDPYEFLEYMKNNSINVKNVRTPEDAKGKILIGEF